MSVADILKFCPEEVHLTVFLTAGHVNPLRYVFVNDIIFSIYFTLRRLVTVSFTAPYKCAFALQCITYL